MRSTTGSRGPTINPTFDCETFGTGAADGPRTALDGFGGGGGCNVASDLAWVRTITGLEVFALVLDEIPNTATQVEWQPKNYSTRVEGQPKDYSTRGGATEGPLELEEADPEATASSKSS